MGSKTPQDDPHTFGSSLLSALGLILKFLLASSPIPFSGVGWAQGPPNSIFFPNNFDQGTTKPAREPPPPTPNFTFCPEGREPAGPKRKRAAKTGIGGLGGRNGLAEVGSPKKPLLRPTVDGYPEIAPPKKPRIGDSPINANKRYGFQWFQSVVGFRPSTVWPDLGLFGLLPLPSLPSPHDGSLANLARGMKTPCIDT